MAPVESNTLHLARHYLDIDKPSAALDALGRSTGDELEDPEYWLLRARAQYRLDHYREGVDAARRGLDLDADDVALLDVLALCQLESGQAAEAAATLAAALELEPDNELLLAHRGLVLARAGDAAGARKAIADAMQIAPDSPLVLQVRAQVAWLNDDESAVVYALDLLDANPDDPVGHALLGNLSSRKKRYVSASRAFDTAARLDPGNEELTRVARSARIAAHPILAPVRPMWRLGRWRAYFLYIAIFLGLGAAGLHTEQYAAAGIWLGLVVLSRAGPRFLRWRSKRRYGGF